MANSVLLVRERERSHVPAAHATLPRPGQITRRVEVFATGSR